MKIAIITGASSGIGKETAELFSEQGYKVFNISRSPCELDDVHSYKIDLGKTSFHDLRKTLHPLLEKVQDSEKTVLVHNASKLEKDDLYDCSDEQLLDVCQVNIIAPQKLNLCFIPLMPKGSSVLYIGSTLSEKAVGGAFSYITTKHALAGMMKATCQDLAGKGIHTALICPGFTDTKMLRKHLNNDDEILESVKQLNTFKRLIEPNEMARVVKFASENPVLNGSVLHANLGQIEA